MKKSIYLVITFIFITIICLNFRFSENIFAQSNQIQKIDGYAWSSNIGWVDFTNTKVTVDDSGNLNGYAWSSNIGWLKFGDLSGFPDSNFGGNAKFVNDKLTGWAQFTNGNSTSGWDGWVLLSGSNHNISLNKTNNRFSGYAWGDDVVGWIDFSGLSLTEDTKCPFGTTINSDDTCSCNNGSTNPDDGCTICPSGYDKVHGNCVLCPPDAPYNSETQACGGTDNDYPRSDDLRLIDFKFIPNIANNNKQCPLYLDVKSTKGCTLVSRGGALNSIENNSENNIFINKDRFFDVGSYTLSCIGLDNKNYSLGNKICYSNPDIREN